MTIGFATFEKQDNRPKGTIGSTRIRARWLYDLWPEAEEYQIGKKYDVMIFQKVYWDTMMEQFDGIKIMDLCDPDWVEGRDVMKYCAMADAVVTSTQPLADYIKRFITDKPVICIPDRIKMAEHEPYMKKTHEEVVKSVVWFGYLHNATYFDNTLDELIRRNVSLTVIANKEYHLPRDKDLELHFVKYGYPSVHEELSKHDIVLLPGDRGKVDYRGQFKSNNKVLTAQALGVPVVQFPEDFDRLITKEQREKEAELKLKDIHDNWLVEQSISEYKDLINEISNNRK